MATARTMRDWLYVCRPRQPRSAPCSPAAVVGETYNIGGWNEKTNLEIVQHRLRSAGRAEPFRPRAAIERLITYVKDRPGHDRRYAIDARKVERELGWRPAETFETGIRKTVQWYLDQSGLGGRTFKAVPTATGSASTMAVANELACRAPGRPKPARVPSGDRSPYRASEGLT